MHDGQQISVPDCKLKLFPFILAPLFFAVDGAANILQLPHPAFGLNSTCPASLSPPRRLAWDSQDNCVVPPVQWNGSIMGPRCTGLDSIPFWRLMKLPGNQPLRHPLSKRRGPGTPRL